MTRNSWASTIAETARGTTRLDELSVDLLVVSVDLQEAALAASGGSGGSEQERKLVPVRSLLAAEPRFERAPCALSSP